MNQRKQQKMYKLLALDIDGTLTNDDKVIPAETVDAIIKLQQRGCKVVLASGRSEYGLMHLAKELKLSEYGGYLMSFNGGRITECSRSKIIYDVPLSLEEAKNIYLTAVEYGVGILGYEKNCLVSGNGIDKYQEDDAWACRMQLKAVKNFPDYFSVPFNKCLLTGDPEHMKDVVIPVREKYGDRLSITMSEPFFIDIMPNGVDKGTAMKNLSELTGIEREEMVCVGDGRNDLSMIEYAGLGVAMGNAHPDVIEKADYVTDTNNNNGVLKVINKFF